MQSRRRRPVCWLCRGYTSCPRTVRAGSSSPGCGRCWEGRVAADRAGADRLRNGLEARAWCPSLGMAWLCMAKVWPESFPRSVFEPDPLSNRGLGGPFTRGTSLGRLSKPPSGTVPARSPTLRVTTARATSLHSASNLNRNNSRMKTPIDHPLRPFVRGYAAALAVLGRSASAAFGPRVALSAGAPDSEWKLRRWKPITLGERG